MLSLPYPSRISEKINIIPYVAPREISAVPEEPALDRPGCLPLRLLIYGLTGVALYFAFCTPLNFAYTNVFNCELWIGRTLIPIGLLIGSSLLAGLAFEPLVRRRVNTVLLGLGYMALTLLLFSVVGSVIDSTNFNGFWEMLPYRLLASVAMTPLYSLLTLHLSAPICILAIHLAGRTLDMEESQRESH